MDASGNVITDTSDQLALVQEWLSDPNIDYLSPQLYSAGDVFVGDATTGANVPWSVWQTSKAAIVPSIPTEADLSTLQAWAATNGITVQGYVLWEQK